MDINQALYTHLSTYAGLVALCGKRIYPLTLPQEPTLPAVTYQRVSGARMQAFGGSVGVARPRYQVTAWALTFVAAREIATQVRAALDKYSGALGGAGGVQTDATILNEIDMMDTDTGWYYVVQDYELWHAE